MPSGNHTLIRWLHRAEIGAKFGTRIAVPDMENDARGPQCDTLTAGFAATLLTTRDCIGAKNQTVLSNRSTQRVIGRLANRFEPSTVVRIAVSIESKTPPSVCARWDDVVCSS